MDRRFFIKSVGSIVAAVSVPTIAFAEDKYTKSIRLLELAKEAKNGKLFTQRFDDVIHHVHQTFRVPIFSEEAAEEVHKMIGSQGPGLKAYIQSSSDLNLIPDKHKEDLFPIGLMKVALTNYDLPVDPSKMKEFESWHERYGKLVVSGCNRPNLRSRSLSGKQAA